MNEPQPSGRCWHHSHLVWGGGGGCEAEPDHDDGSGQDEEAEDDARDAGLSGHTRQPVGPAGLCTPKGTHSHHVFFKNVITLIKSITRPASHRVPTDFL